MQIYNHSFYSLLGVLVFLVPTLFEIAFVTLAERTTMGKAQRRLGPNVVGFWGSLQAFADALKLLLKEYVLPVISNRYLFFAGPVINLVFALLGYLVIPVGKGIFLSDMHLGLFFLIAVSSLGTYGILLSGWASNSKYAFLGALRSTAQLISYELVLSSGILLVIMVTGTFNLISNIEAQRAIWLIFPLFPIGLIFLLGAIAETNRAPFDLAEAESELVSGYMTEYASVVFVFFFLGEYGSILLMCIQTSVLFVGGYLIFSGWEADVFSINLFFQNNLHGSLNLAVGSGVERGFSFMTSGFFSALCLGVKTIFFVVTFITVRASLPRIRFDQLMALSWIHILPILFAFIIFIPALLYSNDSVVPHFQSIFFGFPFFLKLKSEAPRVTRRFTFPKRQIVLS